MKFSVVIPARNEERYIGGCLEALGKAARGCYRDEVEIIVVLNRCTTGQSASPESTEPF